MKRGMKSTMRRIPPIERRAVEDLGGKYGATGLVWLRFWAMRHEFIDPFELYEIPAIASAWEVGIVKLRVLGVRMGNGARPFHDKKV